MRVFVSGATGVLGRELGWQPRFPSIYEGLAQVVAAWRNESRP